MAVSVDLDPSGRHIKINAEWRFKELCKALPGSSWSTEDGVWRVPLSWSSCLALRSTFQDQLVIEPGLEAWAFDKLNSRISPALALRDLEEYDGDDDLFPHQRAGVAFLSTAKRALLADEPGLGKTAQAIRALKALQDQGEEVFPALIVCPNTLKKNWEREFKMWWPGVKTQVIKGTSAKRKKQFREVQDLIESSTCALHPVTPNSDITLKKSAEIATSETSGLVIQSLQNVNEKTQDLGQKVSEPTPTNDLTHSVNTELLQKSTTSGSLEATINASYVEIEQEFSTTAIQQEQSGEYSASTVTPAFIKQTETSTGLIEQECTCSKVAIIINWESLRSHSRLSKFGSIALTKCKECGGHDEKVSVNRCEVHKGELNEIDFKAVIADEIHRSKEPKSKQTRALWAATGDADIRFALTGTPIANDVVDLWSILHWLSPEDWPTKSKWIDRYIDTMMNAFGGMMVIGVKPHMQDEFYKTVNPYMRRMLKKTVLPWLPEVVKERRDVEMSTKQKKAYDQMRDHMIAELGEGDVISAPSILTQTLRLLQFASSYAELEVDETTGEPRAILSDPSCKVDALMNDIKSGDFGDDSVAVCAVSRQLIDLLSAALTKAEIPHGLITGAQNEDERQWAIEDFQSGKTKWILFTAQAGGVGVTLTAARRLIMLQRPWSLVDYKQALDRVHRIGSEIHDSIIITDYVTEGTIEERVIEVLDTKADNFEQIVRDKDKLLSLLLDDKAGRL